MKNPCICRQWIQILYVYAHSLQIHLEPRCIHSNKNFRNIWCFNKNKNTLKGLFLLQFAQQCLPEIMAVKFSPQHTCATLNGSLSNDGDVDSHTDTPRPSWPLKPWPNTYNCPFSENQAESSVSFLSSENKCLMIFQCITNLWSRF